MAITDDNILGNYLRDRRARLSPQAFGFGTLRRRTPGLRREEVAQRANVSPTWYTWLEQGRGGMPSADVQDRIARALTLTEVEREHLFLLAQHRPPRRDHAAPEKVSARLQALLDSWELSPAIVQNATWDIIAWNRAAAAVLTDYGKLAPEQRNVLRLMFGNPRVREVVPDWENVARFVVAAFRADVVRAGLPARVEKLVDDLGSISADFALLWRQNDVNAIGEGTKRMRHPVAGPLALDYSSFLVDGQPGLRMMVYCPATAVDASRIGALLQRH